MNVRARFAPSPTGYLHLGGARTALFCRAWAKRQGGAFLLRIEDTDPARSRKEFVRPIFSALQWLGLEWDGDAMFQSARRELHLRAANILLESGAAYRCYCGPDELAKMREEQVARGENPQYDRRWRDPKTPPTRPPQGVAPAIRFKSPLQGATRFRDIVKGEMAVDNSALDDFVIVRADGSPTYNLACAADDSEMRITDVIRGDDHVMNTFKQILIHSALAKTEWNSDAKPGATKEEGDEGGEGGEGSDEKVERVGGRLPRFAHLPMILNAAVDGDGNIVSGPDGEVKYERMSKRNGAVDVLHYRASGFLPSALLNYLARLSWSHGDDEKFSPEEFARNFDLSAAQKSPARFDMEKLRWLNREHMRDATPDDLRRAGLAMSPGDYKNEFFWNEIRDSELQLTLPRASTLAELRSESEFFVSRPNVSPEAIRAHLDGDNRAALNDLREALAQLPEWSATEIKSAVKEAAKRAGLKFPRLGMPMRALLTGASESPDIAQTAEALGREETLERMRACESV